MLMFRFRFSAEPTPGAKGADGIASALIEVWVVEKSIETAEAKARSYIMGYAWIVKELEIAETWPEELCPDPDKSPEAFGLYRKAEIHGIAAAFHAWPKAPRPGIWEYRSLGDPLTPNGEQ